MNELVKQFQGIKKGQKITTTMESMFGKEVKVKMTYMGEVKQHGYINGGSWGLYKTDKKEKECYKVLVREYKKKNIYWIRLEWTIKSMKLGW